MLGSGEPNASGMPLGRRCAFACDDSPTGAATLADNATFDVAGSLALPGGFDRSALRCGRRMQQFALLRLKGSAEQQDTNAWREKPGHGMAPGEGVLENTDREREMGDARGLRGDTSYCYALRTSRGSQLLPRLTKFWQHFRCGANGGVAPCSARRSTFARRLRVLRATHRLPFPRLVPGRPPAASRCGRKVRAP